jgi:hypothetical protein
VLATSFGTKAIDCFLELSTSMPANVFLGCFLSGEDETVLLAPTTDEEKGNRGSFSIT